jgi:hypothetical protein
VPRKYEKELIHGTASNPNFSLYKRNTRIKRHPTEWRKSSLAIQQKKD